MHIEDGGLSPADGAIDHSVDMVLEAQGISSLHLLLYTQYVVGSPQDTNINQRSQRAEESLHSRQTMGFCLTITTNRSLPILTTAAGRVVAVEKQERKRESGQRG